MMSPRKLQNYQTYIVNTGNILSLNDITRKSGQNPTEELTEAINITLKEFKNEMNGDANSADLLAISRSNDDLPLKMKEEPLSNLKIGLKVFLHDDSKSLLKESLEQAFRTLNVQSVHNVIIAYRNKLMETGDDVDSLKNIWQTMEEYVAEQKINQIGLADVEEGTFRTIYDWASVKPAIIQINLATCCVVPPTLQAFCKEKEIQLLTHSDPIDILPKTNVEESFGVGLQLDWVLKYLVHIKCRGVLTTKGYIVRLSRK